MLKEFAGLIIGIFFFLVFVIFFDILLWGYLFHGVFNYQLNWELLAGITMASLVISIVFFDEPTTESN